MDAHFNCGLNEERIVIHYPLNVLLQVRLPDVVTCIVQARGTDKARGALDRMHYELNLVPILGWEGIVSELGDLRHQ